MIAYPDTSFLFSRYLNDRHSLEVDRRLTAQPLVLVTPFHQAELANAIFQQAFRRNISPADAQIAYVDFKQDCQSGVWVMTPPPDCMFSACVDLAKRHGSRLGVRTLDSLHVAAALELNADRFWTFDERQARLAEAEGLQTSWSPSQQSADLSRAGTPPAPE